MLGSLCRYCLFLLRSSFFCLFFFTLHSHWAVHLFFLFFFTSPVSQPPFSFGLSGWEGVDLGEKDMGLGLVQRRWMGERGFFVLCLPINSHLIFVGLVAFVSCSPPLQHIYLVSLVWPAVWGSSRVDALFPFSFSLSFVCPLSWFIFLLVLVIKSSRSSAKKGGRGEVEGEEGNFAPA